MPRDQESQVVRCAPFFRLEVASGRPTTSPKGIQEHRIWQTPPRKRLRWKQAGENQLQRVTEMRAEKKHISYDIVENLARTTLEGDRLLGNAKTREAVRARLAARPRGGRGAPARRPPYQPRPRPRARRPERTTTRRHPRITRQHGPKNLDAKGQGIIGRPAAEHCPRGRQAAPPNQRPR